MSTRTLTSRALGFVFCLGLVVLMNVGVESIASTSRQSTLTPTVPPRPRQSTLTPTVPPRP